MNKVWKKIISLPYIYIISESLRELKRLFSMDRTIQDKNNFKKYIIKV